MKKGLVINCSAGHLGLTSIEYKEHVEPRKQEIIEFSAFWAFLHQLKLYAIIS